MCDEYDFSKGERGKFYSPDAQMNLPVYLEEEVLNYFSEKAKGVEKWHRVIPPDFGKRERAIRL